MEPCHCISLRRAGRRVSAEYDAALAPAGIGVAQFSLLRQIGRQAPLSLTDLGALTELDRSTVGRNVGVLMREGLVATSPGEDGREALLSLSASGRRKLKAAAPLWRKAQQKIEKRLGRNGLRQLETLLAEI